jgi:Leucine-rich repeat (LRR) protein
MRNLELIVILFVTILSGDCLATTHKCKFVRNSVYNYSCEVDNAVKVNSADVFDVNDHLPNKTNDHVKMVTFTRSTVESLPTDIFKSFPNMEILDLIDCKVSTWTRDNLKNAKRLKKLWLDKNQIAELADNLFLGAASSLEVLILRENKIAKISDKTFTALVNLKNLDLDENSLTTISNEIFAPLKKIREINLRGNQLQNIGTTAFKYNVDLQFLNLANNQIESLGDHLFKGLTNLTIVHLHKNKLKTLPSTIFVGCENLLEVKLDENKLESISVNTFETTKRFKMLDIMYNQLENFDGKLLPNGFQMLYIGKIKSTTSTLTFI